MFNFLIGVLVGAALAVTVPYVYTTVSKWIAKAKARI